MERFLKIKVVKGKEGKTNSRRMKKKNGSIK